MAQKEEYSYTMLAKLLIVFLIVHLLAVITLILMFSAEHEVASNTKVPVSSVWCSGKDVLTRRCYFKNLCYHHKEDVFVFVHGAQSVRQGLPRNRQEALADLTGGVEQHGNAKLYFNYVDIPEKAVRKGNLSSTILPDKVVLFKRFKPDNLMHVVHDDLLPLFFTLNDLEHAGARDYRVFFVDDYGQSEHLDLYRLFRSRTFPNSHHPLLKSTVKAEGLQDSEADLICFGTAAVGAPANTRWYQYGFDRPQGPVSNIPLSGQNIRSFVEFVRSGLEIQKYDIDMPRFAVRVRQKYPYAVFFSRKTNRRIINEADLIHAISAEFKLRVVSINFETHSLAEIVHLLENATMLVSVHGAQLVLSMFLPENAVVVELFPYAVPADSYTPYKTLAGISGVNLIYRAWENKDSANTVVHPNYKPEYGGIIHLSVEEQISINETVPVGPHRCCMDPVFLYRIYQDTIVDVASFTTVAAGALMERERRINSTVNATENAEDLVPSAVRNINCSFLNQSGVFHIDWDVPWNLKYLGNKSVQYSVKIQKMGEPTYTPYYTPEIHIEIPANEKGTYYVWISSQIDGISGLGHGIPGKCINL
ncbi:protein O-linked-mannose beta-1,4-N-acetylglucosaminyltransferase 2-like [Paramacrobiotus metropolitanus]|uniref:protein O-linked-mannose beta-1,4-N-acetylglucosaminyltransferase 2-like n=1 Tax=Paramacrobiotus metropolitanus TaxID=2943436 RepID=UPI002445F06F|nr:protein O-linked-mannose beta-1,4-N-acetylglucosaminyltransferase 2-like [Paramacrobiotus metropolitanus]